MVEIQNEKSAVVKFKLKDNEAHYFHLMVAYNQAGAHEEKKHFFRRMLRYSKGRVRNIDPTLYEFYDKWYYSAMRALLSYHPVTTDYAALGKMLIPAIAASEAKRAVETLLRLGFVTIDKDRYNIENQLINTGTDTDSMVVNSFVLGTIDVAREALHRFPKNERNFSAVTMTLSPQAYAQIREKLDMMRREIMDIAASHADASRVYQLNIQLFPLSVGESDAAEKGDPACE